MKQSHSSYNSNTPKACSYTKPTKPYTKPLYKKINTNTFVTILKQLFFILFFVIATTAIAQYPNGGENNYYVYGEKDSVVFPTTGVIKVFNDGTLWLLPYSHNPLIKGNNYTLKIAAFENFKTPSIYSGQYNLSSPNLWIANNNKAICFNKNKIVDSFTMPFNGYSVLNYNNRLLLAYYNIDNNSFYVGERINNQNKMFGAAPIKAEATIGEMCLFNIGNKLCVGNINDYCYVNSNGYGQVFSRKTKVNSNLIIPFIQSKQFVYTMNKTFDSIFRFNQNNIEATPQVFLANIHCYPSSFNNLLVNNKNLHKQVIEIVNDTATQKISLAYFDEFNAAFLASQKSYYINTSNKLLRTFEYIQRYPKIFNSNNSNLAFALTQASNGNIWAGSYNGGLASISKTSSKYFNLNKFKITNGSCSINNKQLFISEGAKKGIFVFDEKGNYKHLFNEASGFIFYIDTTEKLVYYGSCDNGLFFTSFKNIDNNGKESWKKINRQQGLTLPNILTITKDKVGRIWMGQSSRGWAVYYPKQNKATTFLIENNQTNFGTMSSCTDTKGTVWLGTKQQGLLYYNNYKSDTVNPKDIKTIEHPLLSKNKTISAIVQHGNWLIMGVTNYYVAFDLATWYSNGKVLVKYLNPQEANFTSETEQNTLLVDKRDSSVWFSTNNMLYQWDFKTWLQLPNYTAMPSVNIQYSSIDTSLSANTTFYLKPTQNNVNLQVWFQTIDNMPRYLATAFGKIDDSLQFESVTLNTNYSYSNLASGNYVFKVLICQSDGSVSYHNYFITVNKFWWQHWRVWFIASLLLFTPIVLWLNSKRKQANLFAATEEQKKQLANLQLVTLSNQFRPHFILNALNAIGTQLQGKPKAESVLSRLGESVNIIFNHSLNNKPTQAFINEWKLVTNIVQLHQLMYLQNFVCKLPSTEELQQFAIVELPMGILQIPVENALMHGLGNKIDNNEKQLTISIYQTENNFECNIIDNGIGRTKAQQLSNFTKHGLGTKNLFAIIEMLNKNNINKISFVYADDIYEENNIKYGTKVTITIPKNFKYE